MFHLGFTFLAILSAVFAAFANIMARTLLKNVKSQTVLPISFLSMASTLIVLSPFFYSFDANWQSVGLVLAVGLIDSVANYFYFKVFETTESSVATPVLSLAPGFTFFFSWLFLSDTVSLRTILLAVLVIGLIVFLSTDFKNLKRFRATTLVPALAASFFYGISAIPSKEVLSQLHAINALTLFMFRAMIIMIVAFLFFGKPKTKLSSKQGRFIFLRGLFVIAQWSLLYVALTKGNAGVAVTLANITPVFVLILSALLLRERPTLKKAAAAILVLVLSILI